MFAVEFQTKITDGMIELPAAYRDRLTGSVRVIILADESSGGPDVIEELLDRPLEIEQFTPLERDQIYARS
jgi:hypothetical protein